MKKENKKLLTDLYYEYSAKKYPNMPRYAIAIPKFSDNGANELTQCILKFCKYKGYQAERISNTGRVMDNTKMIKDVLGRTRIIGSIDYIKGTGTNGTADISATIPVNIAGRKIGMSVKIEVKYGRDRQSEAQKKYQKMIEDAGGVYIIVRSFDDFIDKYNELTNV